MAPWFLPPVLMLFIILSFWMWVEPVTYCQPVEYGKVMRCHSCDVLLLDLLFFFFDSFEEASFLVVQLGLWKGPYGKKPLEIEGGFQPTALFYGCKEMNSANNLSGCGSRWITFTRPPNPNRTHRQSVLQEKGSGMVSSFDFSCSDMEKAS